VGSIRSAWRGFITAVGLLSYPGIKYGCESSQLWMEAVTISDSCSRSEFSGGTAESARGTNPFPSTVFCYGHGEGVAVLYVTNYLRHQRVVFLYLTGPRNDINR